jgi:hypothetical protein
MPFLWIDVDDAPGPSSQRGEIEAAAIALLSNLDRPSIDAPSADWLGRRANRPLIQRSGMWNVNHVQDAPPRALIPTLERYVK